MKWFIVFVDVYIFVVPLIDLSWYFPVLYLDCSFFGLKSLKVVVTIGKTKVESEENPQIRWHLTYLLNSLHSYYDVSNC